MIFGTKYKKEKTDQNVKNTFSNIFLQIIFWLIEILYMARTNFKNLFQNHSSLDVRLFYMLEHVASSVLHSHMCVKYNS